MKASEAKKITERNIRGPIIQPFLDIIYRKIKTAANGGKNSITDPLHGERIAITPIERDAVYVELAQQGYKVVYHQDPDFGSRCKPYVTVSW